MSRPYYYIIIFFIIWSIELIKIGINEYNSYKYHIMNPLKGCTDSLLNQKASNTLMLYQGIYSQLAIPINYIKSKIEDTVKGFFDIIIIPYSERNCDDYFKKINILRVFQPLRATINIFGDFIFEPLKNVFDNISIILHNFIDKFNMIQQLLLFIFVLLCCLLIIYRLPYIINSITILLHTMIPHSNTVYKKLKSEKHLTPGE